LLQLEELSFHLLIVCHFLNKPFKPLLLLLPQIEIALSVFGLFQLESLDLFLELFRFLFGSVMKVFEFICLSAALLHERVDVLVKG